MTEKKNVLKEYFKPYFNFENSVKKRGLTAYEITDNYISNTPQLSMEKAIRTINTYINNFKLSQMELTNIDKGIIYKSNLHGISHLQKVVFLGIIICAYEGINKSDFELLLLAFKYHDIGRVDDHVDLEHGSRSAEKLTSLVKLNEEDKFILYNIVTAHSREECYISNLIEEVDVDEHVSSRLIKLSKILKDADNLDRVRLKHNSFDPSYLRTNTAKQLVGVTCELFEYYKFENNKV